MKNIKIIALDMDGVVNSYHHIKEYIDNKRKELAAKGVPPENLENEANKAFKEQFSCGKELIFEDLAANVKRICEETGCKILWSSTWRTVPEYLDLDKAREMFDKHNLPGDALIDATPDLGGDSILGHVTRGSEISHWIKNNGKYKIEKCAVIDDRRDAGKDLPENAKFFKTWESDGLTEEITNDIITYLEK